jgi:hypothetical protein
MREEGLGFAVSLRGLGESGEAERQGVLRKSSHSP